MIVLSKFIQNQVLWTDRADKPWSDSTNWGMITGAAIVDLSAAYDTVNHRIFIQKLYNITQGSHLCRVLQNMLSNSRFYVELNNERSRWRI